MDEGLEVSLVDAVLVKKLRKKFRAVDVSRELRYFRKLFRSSINRKIIEKSVN